MLLIFLMGLLVAPLHADVPATQQAVVSAQYAGGFKDDYPVEMERVRIYLPLTLQDISTKLGLIQYGRGFYHPVTIRFQDGSPAYAENPYFYVRSSANDSGYQQELVANVEAFAKHRQHANPQDNDLRNGFHYAMTQLVLNDLAGGQLDKVLPLWAQEGLAVYVSGDGDEFVQDIAGKVTRSQAADLVGDLNETFPYLTKKQYTDYYLAIKYIVDKHGLDNLQGFIRDLVAGKSAADTVLDVFNFYWADFEKAVKAYSLAAYQSAAPPDDDQGTPVYPQKSSQKSR
jgi:hypothetical protein